MVIHLKKLPKKYYRLKVASKVKRGSKLTKVIPCSNCSRPLRIQNYWIKHKEYKKFYCDKSCESKGKSYGENEELKGGYIDKITGYHYVRVNKKHTLVHRVLMERKLGRKLEKWEQVHHMNGIRNDNRLENLMVVKNTDHASEESKRNAQLKKRILKLEAELKKYVPS